MAALIGAAITYFLFPRTTKDSKVLETDKTETRIKETSIEQ